jgi:hypothetical protein
MTGKVRRFAKHLKAKRPGLPANVVFRLSATQHGVSSGSCHSSPSMRILTPDHGLQRADQSSPEEMHRI